jgi:pimeloyl-ACP methyl ester carboxylesterase
MSTWLNPPIEPQFRTVDGVSLRFAESDRGTQHALLLSPFPESLFAFVPTWAALAEHAHLVAVDLPGFGHSERRATLLSPQAMGEFLIHVLDAFGLEQPHIVAPDIGTSAALFAAAARPDRVRSLVVGSGASAFPLVLGGPLREWVDARDLEEYQRTDSRRIVSATLTGVGGEPLPDFVRDDYLSSYDGARFVESLAYVRSYPVELRTLRYVLPQIQTPVQIIAGGRDPLVPPLNGTFLHERLTNSKLDIVDAGHFVWEERPQVYASLVTSWWDEGHRAIPA